MKISVTRALAELKLLDGRIGAAIAQGVFVGVVRGNKETPIGVPKTAAQLSADIQASYQSVESLIKRRESIKRSIIVSNGRTNVSIGGETMTVAEAIEKKASIKYLEQFYNVLNSQLVNANYQANTQNARVDTDIEKRLLAVYGSDKTKITEEAQRMVAEAVKTEQSAKLLDPVGIEAKSKAVWKKYEDFVSEVDFALSESNAKTEIEVE